MLKEFRNKHALHFSRVFETMIAADMSMKVIIGGVKKSGREFITDTLKARISTNLNELRTTKR